MSTSDIDSHDQNHGDDRDHQNTYEDRSWGSWINYLEHRLTKIDENISKMNENTQKISVVEHSITHLMRKHEFHEAEKNFFRLAAGFAVGMASVALTFGWVFLNRIEDVKNSIYTTNESTREVIYNGNNDIISKIANFQKEDRDKISSEEETISKSVYNNVRQDVVLLITSIDRRVGSLETTLELQSHSQIPSPMKKPSPAVGTPKPN